MKRFGWMLVCLLMALALCLGAAWAQEEQGGAPAMPAPQCTLLSDTVEIGAPVCVSVTPQGVAGETYTARLTRESDDEVVAAENIEMMYAALSTVSLEPGQYTLIVTAAAPGYESSQASWDVTLTSGTGDVVFFVNSTEILTGQTLVASIYAPGATQVCMYWEEEEEYAHFPTDGEYSHLYISMDEAGDHVLKAAARYEGSDEWVVCDTLYPIHFTAPYGKIRPTLTCPGAVVVGESVQVGVEEVEGAYEYHLFVKDRSTGTHIYSETSSLPIAHTLPADAFEAGRQYQVYCQVRAVGYETGNVQRILHAVSAIDPHITLTINGQSGTAEALVNQYLRYEIQGPADATALRMDRGYGWWSYYVGNTYVKDTSSSLPESLTVLVEYTKTPFEGNWPDWDSLQWSDPGEPVVLNLSSMGTMPEYEASIAKNTFKVGETVYVSVSPLGLTGENYIANIYKASDGMNVLNANWNGRDAILIDTSALDAGDYTLTVSAFAVGYESRAVEMSFTLEAMASGEVLFTVNSESVNTYEAVYASVYAPGAQGIRLLQNGELYNETWGERLNAEFEEHEPADWTLSAQVMRDDAWEDVPQTRHVQILAPYGQADADATLPQRPGDNGVWTVDFGTSRGSVHEAWIEDADYNWLCGGQSQNGAVEVDVRRLAPGVIYRFHAMGRGVGYIAAETSFPIIVTEDQNGMKIEPLPDEPFLLLDRDIVLTHQYFTISAYVPGADSIRICGVRDDGEECTAEYPGSLVSIPWLFDTQGALTISLQARMTDEENWVDVCDPVPLTIQALNGDLRAPEVSLPSRADPHQDIYIQVGESAGAEVYRLSVIDQFTCWNACSQESPVPTTFHIEPDTLEEGHIYRVTLDILATGYNAYHADFDLLALSEVTNDDITLTVDGQTENAQVFAGASAEITISAPSSSVTAFRFFNGNYWVNCSCADQECVLSPGETTITVWHTWVETGDVILFAEYTEDDFGDYPAEGFDSLTWSAPSPILNLSVREAEKGVYTFTADKTDVLTCERVDLSLSVPGAEHLKLREYRDENGIAVRSYETECDGSQLTEGRIYDDPGTYTYEVIARYPDGEEMTFTENTPVVHVTLLHDETPTFTVTMDDEPQAGQPYSFTINMPLGWFEVYLEGLNIEDQGVEFSGSHTFTVPAEAMRPGAMFTVFVYAYAPGYRPDYSYARDIFVTPDQTPGAVLTVNGSAQDTSVLVGERVEIRVDAPGFVRGQMYSGYGWWNDIYEVPEYRTMTWNNEGEHHLVLRYTDQEADLSAAENDIDWKYSNTVTVTSVKKGDLPPVLFSLSSRSVERGDVLEAAIADPMDDVTYQAVVNGETYESDGEGRIRIDTITLEPGEWDIWVSASKPGYPTQRASDAFTVTPRQDDSPFFTVSPAQVETMESYTVSGYVPGATRLAIMTENEYGDTWQQDEVMGCGISFTQSMPSSEIFTHTLLAWFTEDGEEEPTQVLSPVTVHILASQGEFENVNVHVPGLVESGEDLVVTIDPIQGATHYMADLYTTGWDRVSIQESSASGAFTFASGSLQQNQTYFLQVSATGRGYEQYVETYRVIVAGDLRDITLTANGVTELECLTNEEYTVRAEAPSAATAVRILWGTSSQAFLGNTAEKVFYSPTEETATFYAQYTLDPVNESMEEEDFNSLTWCGVSQPVTVHAIRVGSLMLPEIAADPGLRVHRGDTVTLSYTPFGYEGEGGSLYIYGVDPDTGEDTLAGRYYHNGECQFTVDTTEMAPGEYTLSIWGWAYGYDRFSERLTLCVLDESAPAVQLTATKTELTLDIDNETTFHVYAPGASSIEIYTTGNPWILWNGSGETGEYTTSFYSVGEYEMYARAVYTDGTAETSEMVTVRVSSLGKLAAPVIDLHGVEGTLASGQDLTFTVEPVEGAETYRVNVYMQYDMPGENWMSVAYYTDPGTYTLPASQFTGGKAYKVQAQAHAPGYEWDFATKVFYVVDPAWGKGTMAVTGLEDDGTVLINKPFHIVLDAPGATCIKWKAGDNYSWKYTMGSHVDTDFSYGIAGTHTILAMYTTAEIADTSEMYSFTNWNGCFDPFTVKAVAYGMLQVDGELSQETFHQGDVISVRLTSPQDQIIETYWVEWYDDESSTYYNRVESADGTFELDTAYLPLGTYNLYIGATAPGWGIYDRGIQITVLEPEERRVTFTIEPEEVLLMQIPDMRISAPGAERIDIYEGGELIHSATGASWRGVVGYTEGQHTLYAVATYPDGETARSEDVTYTVTVLGEIPAPAYTMPRTIYSGDTLQVHVGAVEGAHGSVVLVKVNGEIAAYGQIEGENGGDITVDMSAFAPGVYDVSVGTSSSTQGYRGGMVDTTVQVLDRNAPVMSLPASLTAIEQEAFCGLPARVVSVPASVTAIGSRAFADCASLGFVIFEGDGGSIAGDAFTGSPYVTFLCPDGSAAARYADAHGIGHRPR